MSDSGSGFIGHRHPAMISTGCRDFALARKFSNLDGSRRRGRHKFDRGIAEPRGAKEDGEVVGESVWFARNTEQASREIVILIDINEDRDRGRPQRQIIEFDDGQRRRHRDRSGRRPPGRLKPGIR